jgi:uncharacterized membrane protein YphA (DoxX/SURF4 family)
MSSTAASKNRKTTVAAGVLTRWLIGALFIYMGLNKALHPVDFLKLTRDYDLVTTPFLLNAIAAGLPWFEVFCGLMLVLGIAVRGTSLVLVAMLVPFTLMVLRRALHIADLQQIAFCAVKFDCGCGTGEVYICRKLVENTLLTLLSLWLTTGMGNRLAARFALARPNARSQPSELSRQPA